MFGRKSKKEAEEIKIDVLLDRYDPAIKTFVLTVDCGRKRVALEFSETAFRNLMSGMGDALEQGAKVY